MEYQKKKDIPYEEIENGALLLLLLRETKTWATLGQQVWRGSL